MHSSYFLLDRFVCAMRLVGEKRRLEQAAGVFILWKSNFFGPPNILASWEASLKPRWRKISQLVSSSFLTLTAQLI